MARQY